MSVFNSIANWNPWVYYHARTSKSLVSQECFYQFLTFSILKYLNFTFTAVPDKRHTWYVYLRKDKVVFAVKSRIGILYGCLIHCTGAQRAVTVGFRFKWNTIWCPNVPKPAFWQFHKSFTQEPAYFLNVWSNISRLSFFYHNQPVLFNFIQTHKILFKKAKCLNGEC